MIRLKRFLVTALSLTFCYIMQMVVLPRIPYLIAVPNLLLIEVLSVGFLFGKAYGLAVGVVCGFLMDILGTGTWGFYTLIFAWLGYGNGVLSEKMELELLYVLFLLLILNEGLYHVYVFVFAFLLRRSFSLPVYIRQVVLPEYLLTAVCFIVIYGILIYLSRRWDLKVNKGAVKVVS